MATTRMCPDPTKPPFPVRPAKWTRRWLTFAWSGVGLAGGLSAADFSLLSTSVSSLPAPGTAPVPGRFSLQQTTATLVPSGPAAGTGRFALTATAGSAVAIQQPGLPQLRFQPGPMGVELTWDDAGVNAGLLLEGSLAVTGGWETLPVELTATGRRYVLTGGTTIVGPRFFRLRKP